MSIYYSLYIYIFVAKHGCIPVGVLYYKGTKEKLSAAIPYPSSTVEEGILEYRGAYMSDIPKRGSKLPGY